MVDDRAGRRQGVERGVKVTGTLETLCGGVRDKIIEVAEAATVVDLLSVLALRRRRLLRVGTMRGPARLSSDADDASVSGLADVGVPGFGRRWVSAVACVGRH